MENSSPPLPQFRSDATHMISQKLQNLHIESCIDSLTLRYEFMVHNSMPVKKNHQHDWFFICFSVIFSVLVNLSVSTLCSVTSARCRTRRSTILHLWWPSPRIHRFLLRFCSQRNTLSITTFAQEWAVSVQSWRKPFSFPNVPSKSCERTTFPNQVLLLSFWQSVGGHWAWENAHDWCFHYHLRWRGVMAFPKMLDPLENSSFL